MSCCPRFFIDGQEVTGTGSRQLVHAAWWGHSPSATYQENDTAVAAAIAALPDGGIVQLGKGTFKHKLIDITSEDITLQGTGWGTIIKLPDVTEYQVNVGGNSKLSGISSDGVDRVTIRDLQYDGNCANHQSFIETLWETYPDVWDANGAFGVYLGTFNEALPARTPAKHVIIDNVYIHDVIRDHIIFGDGVHVQGSNLYLVNSLVDHIIYCDTGHSSSFVNVNIEGYWRGAAVIGQGQDFDNVTVKNMAANPTNGVTAYDLDAVVAIRGADNIRPTRFSNTRIEDALAANLFYVFQVRAGLTVNNLFVEQTDTDTSQFFDLFQVNTTTATSHHLTVTGYEVHGVSADNFRIYTTSGSNASSNANLSGGRVLYRELSATGTRNIPLFNLANDFNGLHVADLQVSTDATRLFSCDSGKDISDCVFKNIRMYDAVPPNFNLVVINSGAFGIVIKDSRFDANAFVDASFLENMDIKNCTFGTSHSNGSGLFSSAVAQQTYTIPHGLIRAPNRVSVTPASERAKVDGSGRLTFHTYVDATNVYVEFDRAVVLGGGENVDLWWEAAITKFPTVV